MIGYNDEKFREGFDRQLMASGDIVREGRGDGS